MELIITIGFETAVVTYGLILATGLLVRLGWLPKRLRLAGRVIGRRLAARRWIGPPVRLLQGHPVTGGALVSGLAGVTASLVFVSLVFAVMAAAGLLFAAAVAMSIAGGPAEAPEEDDERGIMGTCFDPWSPYYLDHKPSDLCGGKSLFP